MISTGKVSYSMVKDSRCLILQPFIRCHFRKIFHRHVQQLRLYLLQPPKKKNRWSKTEEKLLIEVYRGNKQRLKYNACSSPECQEVAEDLRSRCLTQQVSCEKTPKQCKDKLVNLTRPSKTNCALLALVKVENHTKMLISMSRMI